MPSMIINNNYKCLLSLFQSILCNGWTIHFSSWIRKKSVIWRQINWCITHWLPSIISSIVLIVWYVHVVHLYNVFRYCNEILFLSLHIGKSTTWAHLFKRKTEIIWDANKITPVHSQGSNKCRQQPIIYCSI